MEIKRYRGYEIELIPLHRWRLWPCFLWGVYYAYVIKGEGLGEGVANDQARWRELRTPEHALAAAHKEVDRIIVLSSRNAALGLQLMIHQHTVKRGAA